MNPDQNSKVIRLMRESLPPPFERYFRPWQYVVGHMMLLLRSPKEGRDGGTRVDVLFQTVTAMLLLDWYPRLEISLATDEQRARIEQLGIWTSDLSPPYVLSDEPFSFVQAAGPVAWREGHGGFDEPSIIGAGWPPLGFD